MCVLGTMVPAHGQRAAEGQRLEIIRAVYGSRGHQTDVTARLRMMVRNNRLDVVVSNDTMGGDPNEHSRKTLRVDYSLGNRRRRRTVNEHDRLVLP